MSLTKQDLQSIENIVENVVDRKTNRFATKDDLKSFATKMDIEEIVGKAESRIVMAMGLLQRDTFSKIDGLELRVSRLEKLSNT